jgi:hypothetical protein
MALATVLAAQVITAARLLLAVQAAAALPPVAPIPVRVEQVMLGQVFRAAQRLALAVAVAVLAT